jgi:hypothetical protein
MANIDRFIEIAATLPKGGVRPWWDKLGLDPDRQESLREAILHPEVTDRAVQLVLREWGHEIKLSSIGHYRRVLRG